MTRQMCQCCLGPKDYFHNSWSMRTGRLKQNACSFSGMSRKLYVLTAIRIYEMPSLKVMGTLSNVGRRIILPSTFTGGAPLHV